MSASCIYCEQYGWNKDTSYTCTQCEKHVAKLDQETVQWIAEMIDRKVEKAIEKHTDKYNHEMSNNGYY